MKSIIFNEMIILCGMQIFKAYVMTLSRGETTFIKLIKMGRK
ncbi:hypothetical protein T11_4987 [Trichinella zimbabwensis]|uniref:Uncharacterized protein n=1 Tax=Trichinella zimbabwensis TaxID=268475 RepID=A0A0V1GE44_9BILA|nr:hypothetical protein T11_4987 [Trichinella zimbabwensis]